MIGIERGAADVDAFRTAKRVLDEGHVLIVFPEGTRSPTGMLQEAKEGTTILALRTGARIVPIGISGTPRVWPRGQKAAASGPGDGSSSGSASRSRSRRPGAGAERRAAQVAATTEIMRRIAALLPPAQRGVYADGRRPSQAPPSTRPSSTHEGPGPRAIIEAMGHRSRRPDRQAHRASATASARRSTRPRRRRPPGKATHTLGQVVHNEGVIRDLEAIGIETVDTLDDVDHGAAVVIRAHGVRPEVMERAEARGLEVIDGTCTWVIQEQKELVKLVEEGYTIVLLGTPKHPEVVGLLGFAPDAIVVDEEEDWAQIPRRKKMALISQSTQPPWKFEKLAALHGLAQPRAQDRQHGLPGHDPAPGGHPRDGPRGRPDGRRRRSLVGQHEGADPAVRDRRDARDPDRERRATSTTPAVFGQRRGRRRDRRHLDPDRGPPGGRRADPRARRDRRARPPAPTTWRWPPCSRRPPRPAGRPRSRAATRTPASSAGAA